MKTISKKQAQKWANALRSGEYSQTREALQGAFGYCCLGVGCKIFIPNKLQRMDNLGFLIGGLPYEQPYCPKFFVEINQDLLNRGDVDFTTLNDSREYTFDMIADIIELVYVHGAL